MKLLFGLLLLTGTGLTISCGGASEAGPHLKPLPPNRAVQYSPESAALHPEPSKKNTELRPVALQPYR